MNIKTNTEITAEFSKTDVENMIKNHAESQGYKVIKIIFKKESKVFRDPISQQDILMGTGNHIPSVDFAGVKVYLEKIESV